MGNWVPNQVLCDGGPHQRGARKRAVGGVGNPRHEPPVVASMVAQPVCVVKCKPPCPRHAIGMRQRKCCGGKEVAKQPPQAASAVVR